MYNNFTASSEPTEELVSSLRDLYSSFGYKRYRMSKFEDYDLYSHNKEFLVSEQIITFTDTNGKLMALKPDVTLSIIRNCPDIGGTSKLFYDENVYRVSKGSGTFREINQVGLECIGDVDLYCLSEVLYLASHSLKAVSPNSVLVVSHLVILSKFASFVSEDPSVRDILFECASKKNIHGVDSLCVKYGLQPEKCESFKKLILLYGDAEKVIAGLMSIQYKPDVTRETEDLKKAMSVFKKEIGSAVIDFSVTGNMNYYNGVVFRGYVEGIPGSILSGGCYDALMYKLGKRSGAVGFALYLDMLDNLYSAPDEYDADIQLIYGENAENKDVIEAVKTLNSRGLRVFCSRRRTDAVKCRSYAELTGGKVKVKDGIS